MMLLGYIIMMLLGYILYYTQYIHNIYNIYNKIILVLQYYSVVTAAVGMCVSYDTLYDNNLYPC